MTFKTSCMIKSLMCLSTILVVYIMFWNAPRKSYLTKSTVAVTLPLHTSSRVTLPLHTSSRDFVQRSLTCRNVLKSMLTGSWTEMESVPPMDMESLQYFLNTSRMQHSLPYGLQRGDDKCGNVTFDELEGKMSDLMWFRALCDPDGETPCCYNNECSDRSEQKCNCEHCYDMRKSINAEFAQWKPRDHECKILPITTENDVCTVLKNMTIYFIGDSFIRHIYISLLDILRQRKQNGVLKQFTSPGLVQSCNSNKQFSYLQTYMKYIDKNTWECEHSVKLEFMEYPGTKHSVNALKAITKLRGKANSLLFIGVGLHDNFDTSKIVDQLIHPLFQLLLDSEWPRILWSAMHAPGLLKTPRVPSQGRESILKFNAEINEVMTKRGIPVFNSFNLTDGMMSFDGAHYGKGVNDVKAQIFLNYVMELMNRNME